MLDRLETSRMTNRSFQQQTKDSSAKCGMKKNIYDIPKNIPAMARK